VIETMLSYRGKKRKKQHSATLELLLLGIVICRRGQTPGHQNRYADTDGMASATRMR
jgi:hypothetical protein